MTRTTKKSVHKHMPVFNSDSVTIDTPATAERPDEALSQESIEKKKRCPKLLMSGEQ